MHGVAQQMPVSSVLVRSISNIQIRTCTFSPVPATPVRLLMPLRPTAAAICLQARLMELMTVASSLSMWPWRSCCKRGRKEKWKGS